MKAFYHLHGYAMRTIYLLLVWLGVMLALSLLGIFDNPTRPPVPLLLAVVIPLVLYLIDKPILKSTLFGGIDELPASAAILIQTFRVLGFIFIVDFARGNLPSGFALPAGIGDITVGICAPWVSSKLMQNTPESNQIARWWNYFGLFDLVLALTMGITHQKSSLGIWAQDVSMRPIGQYPLSLIPTWIVPLALILHLKTLKRLKETSAELATNHIFNIENEGQT